MYVKPATTVTDINTADINCIKTVTAVSANPNRAVTDAGAKASATSMKSGTRTL